MREIEDRIKSGDRDAMAEFLSDGLRNHRNEIEELRRRFELVIVSGHGYDSGIVLALAATAVRARMYEEAVGFAKDFISSDMYADAFHIALLLSEEEIGETASCSILNSLKKIGTLSDEKLLRQKKMG